MKKCRALALPGLAAFVMVLAACATVDVTTTWVRSIETISGRKVVAVAIRYQR